MFLLIHPYGNQYKIQCNQLDYLEHYLFHSSSYNIHQSDFVAIDYLQNQQLEY